VVHYGGPRLHTDRMAKEHRQVSTLSESEMTVALRSLPEYIREQTAHRRDTAGTGGLGYWGARDAIRRIEQERTKKVKQ
jgi:hypothetical protein